MTLSSFCEVASVVAGAGVRAAFALGLTCRGGGVCFVIGPRMSNDCRSFERVAHSRVDGAVSWLEYDQRAPRDWPHRLPVLGPGAPRSKAST